LEKFIISVTVKDFFHQTYSFHRGAFAPHMRQIRHNIYYGLKITTI